MAVDLAFPLLLEAVSVATSLVMLWLSFWIRDRRRQAQEVPRPKRVYLPVGLNNLQREIAASPAPKIGLF